MTGPHTRHRSNNFGIHDAHVLNDGHIGIGGYSRNPDIGFFASGVRPAAYQVDSRVQRSLGALNFTQTARSAPITDSAIDTATLFHLNYTQCQDINYIGFPGGPLQSLWFTLEPSEKDYQARNRDLLLNYEVQKTLLLDRADFFEAIQKSAYTIWPINIGNHWCVIFLHGNTEKPDGLSRKKWPCQIEHIVIADPERNPWVETFVWNRLVDILSNAPGGFDLPGHPQPLWFPTQVEDWSCGLHVYEIMRVMIERINETALLKNDHPRRGRDVYDEALWADMSGDFQPDKIRGLMMGICAVEALRMQGRAGGARLGLVAVDEIRDSFADQVVKPQALTDFRSLSRFQRPEGLARGAKRRRSCTPSRCVKRQATVSNRVEAIEGQLRRPQSTRERRPGSTSPAIPNVRTRRASRAMDALSHWG